MQTGKVAMLYKISNILKEGKKKPSLQNSLLPYNS
jgi:hypothetical protein